VPVITELIIGVQHGAPSWLSMNVSMFRGRGCAGGHPKIAPPSLLSLLFDAYICYLKMAIVPVITKLIIVELFWLDFVNPIKFICFYIN
jgi:ATP-dependent Clp protease protease subunit